MRVNLSPCIHKWHYSSAFFPWFIKDIHTVRPKCPPKSSLLSVQSHWRKCRRVKRLFSFLCSHIPYIVDDKQNVYQIKMNYSQCLKHWSISRHMGQETSRERKGSVILLRLQVRIVGPRHHLANGLRFRAQGI